MPQLIRLIFILCFPLLMYAQQPLRLADDQLEQLVPLADGSWAWKPFLDLPSSSFKTVAAQGKDIWAISLANELLHYHLERGYWENLGVRKEIPALIQTSFIYKGQLYFQSAALLYRLSLTGSYNLELSTRGLPLLLSNWVYLPNQGRFWAMQSSGAPIFFEPESGLIERPRKTWFRNFARGQSQAEGQLWPLDAKHFLYFSIGGQELYLLNFPDFEAYKLGPVDGIQPKGQALSIDGPKLSSFLPATASRLYWNKGLRGGRINWWQHPSPEIDHFELERKATAASSWIIMGSLNAYNAPHQAGFHALDDSQKRSNATSYRLVAVNTWGHKRYLQEICLGAGCPKVQLGPNILRAGEDLRLYLPAWQGQWLKISWKSGGKVIQSQEIYLDFPTYQLTLPGQATGYYELSVESTEDCQQFQLFYGF
ncbi:hypothetical protein PPO43_03615 [Saprospira sp. CCB-QB6]|uniref:hypothetical protein n=1 Tax=Saprospira sp. CCB-QB6 TaxID=3023936 RepID=UPI0023496E64|nr:hypothetical protein [Saprospira sp. CCB-QB6]WCL82190.1 hypothetical protein PPO43_03615 [Saprospira sp. CCB-QB6]